MLREVRMLQTPVPILELTQGDQHVPQTSRASEAGFSIVHSEEYQTSNSSLRERSSVCHGQQL